MRRKGLNLPTGEIYTGQKKERLSKEDSISMYLAMLKQRKENEKIRKTYPDSCSSLSSDEL